MLAAMVEVLAVKAGAMLELVNAAAIKVRRYLQLEVKTGLIIDMQKCGALFAPFFM